jgi:hypothetical protein
MGDKEFLDNEYRLRKERDTAIRAKYGSLREWKKKEFFSMATLKERGWTKALVDKHLGHWDETTSGAYRACELWLRRSVYAAEKTPEVKASLKATLKRADKLAGASMATQERVAEEVAKWPIKLISQAEAIRRMKPSFKKGMRRRELNNFAIQAVKKQAAADLEPRVLAQPKHQRIYRNELVERVWWMVHRNDKR